MADLSLTPATDAALENLVDVTAGVLAENGPMTEEELESALASRGVDPGDAGVSLDEVVDAGDGLLVVLADDRLASLPALLEGRAFTHRVTGPELEHHILAVNPDLEPITAIAQSEAYGQLTDGARVSRVLAMFDADTLTERDIPLDTLDEYGALLLPPGYLRERGCREGDVVAFRFGQDGLRLDILGSAPADSESSTVLGQRLDAVLSLWSGEPMLLNVAVWTACANDPALFIEPLPPLGEVLDSCGLARNGEWLGTSGFDFTRWRADQRCAVIARAHDLDDDQALVVLAIATLFDRAAEDLDDTALRTAVPFLADPAVAKAVLIETIGFDRDGAAELVRFVESLQPMAPRGARPALLWLSGKARERLGDIAGAEADYQAAQAVDPRWAPALADLARYASDRGNAELALSLLRRAEEPPDELVEMLTRFQAPPRPDIGRNSPCWCGSGRKYKKCHLHNEQVPLEERAAWLYQKAGMFLSEGPWRITVMDAAQLRAQHADEPHALLKALDDPLVADAVLFEGGAFADFVTTRGALLPDDERLLAEQWLLADRSVHDIEHVQRGVGLTVRDVRTGDRHQVRERAASRTLRPGQLVCARIVPAGDTMQIFGGLELVALHERDELITLLDAKPGPDEVISFLTRRLAPAEIRNTEGDPIVLCEATLRTADPAALTTALDDAYERDETGIPQWIEHVITDGLMRIRATLSLDENELTVEANSEPRIDRVLDTLRMLDPTLTIIGQSRQPARDTTEAATLTTRAPLAAGDTEHEPEAGDPAMLAALDQFIRDYEQRWLDDRIPALAGYTPREAAADPTRRGDLIRLLDSLPATHNPGTMSPDRLRAALGLPTYVDGWPG